MKPAPKTCRAPRAWKHAPHVALLVGLAALSGTLLDSTVNRRIPERSDAREQPARPVGSASVVQPGTQAVTRAPGVRLTGRVIDERGESVAGAVVRTAGAEPAARSQTDELGAFSLEVPPGEVDLEISAEGHEHVARHYERAPREPLSIRLRRAGMIAGAVTRPDGAAAGGAEVTLAGSGVWPARVVRAGDDGGFELDALPGGVYELHARLGTEVAPPREGVVLEVGHTERVALRLEPGRVLAGVVLDAETEAPLAEAIVTVGEESLGLAPRTVVTDAHGAFAIEGLRGVSHRVSARAEGHVARVAESMMPTDAARIALRRAAQLRGRVVDARGLPVEGVQLELAGTTDEGVPLTLAAPTGDFGSVLAEAQSGGLGVLSGDVPPIPLAPGEGASFAGIAADSGTATTDARGEFRIEGVPPGRVQLIARRAGYGVTATQPALVRAGALLDGIEIALPPASRVVGRVTDARGFPVGRVRVELASDREAWPRGALADADGAFEFEDVSGAAIVTAFPAGSPSVRERVTLAPGDVTRVSLALPGSLRSIAGRAVDARGFAVTSARITVRSLSARTSFARSTWSDAEGRFAVDGAPTGSVHVEGDHPAFATARLDTEDAELTLRFDPAVGLQTTIAKEEDLAPIPGARVVLRGEHGEREARADSIGGVSFARLEAGAYVLRVEAEGRVATERAVTLAATRDGSPVELAPVVLQQSGSVCGEVVDVHAAAVAGAEVAAFRGEGITGEAAAVLPASVRTDAQGRFCLVGHAAGDAVLQATHPAAGEALSEGPLRVRAGEVTDRVRITLPRSVDADAELGAGRRSGVAVQLGSTTDGRARIARVVVGSRAAQAGLRVGDVITAVDDVEVMDAARGETQLLGPPQVEAILDLERGARTLRLAVPRETYEP